MHKTMNALQTASGDVVTVGQAVKWLTGSFLKAGLPSAQLDARLLTAYVLKIGVERLILDATHPISTSDISNLGSVLERRVNREPVSRICGSREFWGLPFRLNKATLDPRPDSETIVSALLTLCEREGRRCEALKLLDLGTGTGCLLLSALSELQGASGVGVDISREALVMARENAIVIGLKDRAEFVNSDWLDGVTGVYDFILANPPYIKADEIAGLAPEVSVHDPRAALDGGISGMDCYAAIIPALSGRVAACGWALLEAGDGQAGAIAELLSEHGFGEIEVFPDFSGKSRVVAGKRHKSERIRS